MSQPAGFENHCPRCGQNRSTHDDGECEAVVRSMSVAASKVHREPAVEIADTLEGIALIARMNTGRAAWEWVLEQIAGIEERVKLEIWKIDQKKGSGA